MTPNPLIKPAMLSRVRAIGARMLTQTFTVMSRSIESNDYGDGVEVWVDAGDHLGWIRMVNKPELGEGVGMVAGVGNFRLHLAPTVNLNEGDLIVDTNGEQYVVNDVNTEDTVKVYTTATLQKRQ